MTNAIEATNAQLFIGGVGTGKTQHLIEQAANLISSAPQGERILALCATPQAACAFSARLEALAGAASQRITVATPRAIALGILGSPEAIAWSGRKPRLLADFEEKFLIEDMKVSGIRPRRLREMLRFFYRSWTELADDDPQWLLPGEETDVHALLKANLQFMRAIVEPEAANLAVNFLRTHKTAMDTARYAYVLVDDYQRLSRASQALANMLTVRSITAAGDPAACVEVYDSFPYEAGLDEFTEMHPQAKVERLSICHQTPAAVQAARALLASKNMPDVSLEAANIAPDTGVVEVLACASPADELFRIAQLVSEAIDNGTEPRDIVVAVPNGTWARNVTNALRSNGLHAKTLPASQLIRGDIRDNAKCTDARLLTALNLAADAQDAAAWRCWCGYGDYLVNSAAMASLRAFAEEQRIGLVQALETISAFDETHDHVVGGRRVAEAYRAGQDLLERVADLKGHTLIDELSRDILNDAGARAPETVIGLCLDDAQSDVDASSMVQRAQTRLTAPQLSSSNAVAVIPYDLTVGLTPSLLIVAGFVNGFIPCRDYFDGAVTPIDKQEKMHAVDTRRVYSLIGKAQTRLVISYFTATDLESASVLKLKISRIRIQDGKRVCTIAPSDFLTNITKRP